MQYYLAPMEGFTDAVMRRTHLRFFPGAGSADRYYSPFVSPTKNHTVNPRQLRDILPENNIGVPLVPQALCRDAGDFLWFAGELAGMGYREVNLNLGCPAGTVVAKGKGSGFLRDPEALDRFFDAVFSAGPPLAVSVKTRLGITEPEEFYPLLKIYDRYPICELIIHPRVQKDFYRNNVRMPVFEEALRSCRHPVCFNGSLVTAADCAALESAHPALNAVMLGRGLLADPALLRRLRGGAPLGREELRAYLDTLYEEYSAAFGSRKNAVRRMKGVWTFALGMFDGQEAVQRQLRHANDPDAYAAFCARVFGTLPLRTDAVQIW